MATVTQQLPCSPLRRMSPAYQELEARIMAETGLWGHSSSKATMFAMVESPRPSAGNAGPQLPAHRVMIPTFKRQKLDTFVPCTSFQAGKQQSIELSPRKNILRLESFSAMNPQPRTPNRNLRKRKSLPPASWSDYPKLEDIQSLSPPPPPPLTPNKTNRLSDPDTPPSARSAKKPEHLTMEECWPISQKLFKHFGTEPMQAKAMLNRYLRKRVGKSKQEVLSGLENEVGPTVMRVRCAPGKKRPTQKRSPGPSRFLKEKLEQEELLMYEQM